MYFCMLRMHKGHIMDKMIKKIWLLLWRFGKKSSILLLFTVFFFWLFPRTSGMRPIVFSTPYKELTVGIGILLFLFTHYFYFIPQYLSTKRYVSYATISVITLLICGAAEILYLRKDLCMNVYQYFSLKEQHYFLLQDFFLVTIRDAGLWVAFILMKEVEIVNEEYAELQKENIKQLHVIKVKNMDKKNVLLNIEEILYCEQKKNYTHFYTTTAEYIALCSLKSVKNQFDGECLQINRSTLVMKQAIKQRMDNYIVLKEVAFPKRITRLIVNERYQDSDCYSNSNAKILEL